MIELMVAIVIIALLAAILVPNFIRSKSQGRASACKSNLRNIATALESYMLDNAGQLPASLSALPPAHLNSIPTCPGAGADTYSPGYAMAAAPTAYTICCGGDNHEGTGLTPNFPQYLSSQGMVER